ncbi:fimbrial assembly protein [Enterobacterales bacterium CwR94]|nr:fimbrial assembly protein [Enterobacterales bacterium CwR94]
MRVDRKKMTFLLLMISSALSVGTPVATARDYFDPALLSLGGSLHTVTDLSAFETAGSTPAGTYRVSLRVNQRDYGEVDIVFSADKQGEVKPELTPDLLSTLGVNTSALPAFAGRPLHQSVGDLTALIPDARVTFDFPQQRLELSIPQVALKPSAAQTTDPSQWDQGMSALLLNYTFNAGQRRQTLSTDGATNENSNVFLGLRGGLNWQAWRLRSDMTYTRNENRDGSSDRQRFQTNRFSNTALQRDIQSWRSDLLMGESQSGNDVFDSIPFRGVKLNSNEEMLPVSLRGFAPEISGIAQSNARITVSQNGNVVYQTYVAPGPFRITDLYQTGLGGNLTVTVTEADGSVRTWQQAFSALPVMQRPGGLKYEVTSGRYNGGITTRSREVQFALGTLIYGLPHNITLYGGGLLAEKYLATVLGSGLSLGHFGALSADVTVSNAELDEQTQRGQSYRIRYAKSLLTTGTSVDLTAYRYSTQHYASFADFNNSGYTLRAGERPWALARQRSDFQVRVSQQLGQYGSLFVSGARSDYWGDEQTNNTLSAGYNTGWRGMSFGLAYSIDRRHSEGEWPTNRQLAFNMQVPFSLLSSASAVSRSYANYQMSRDNQGRVRQQAGISGTAAQERLSYSVTQSWNNHSQSSNDSTVRNLNLGWQSHQGTASVGYSQSHQFNAFNVNANGGMLVHANGLTLSQPLGASSALISAPNAAGVQVMNGGIRTDSKGFAVVPYLSAYQNNTLSLNPATLPDDVDLSRNSANVIPTKGAIVAATFATRTGYQALISLVRTGETVPFGSLVTLNHPAGEVNSGIVGDAGQVYLSGLPERGVLTASWGREAGQQCQATFDLSTTQPPTHNPVRMLTARCQEES